LFLFSVGPLADVDALTSEFKSQHDIVEKVIADYTAKLRSAGVSCFPMKIFHGNIL
jgi:hypothetical protein